MTFFFVSFQKKLYCDLVLYIVGRCDGGLSFVGGHKNLLINLLLFLDMNNASKPWVNSLHGHIII